MADPPSPLRDSLIGGRYRIVRRLAGGGTAEVFEGWDETLARRVALKRLHPHLAADPTVRERFRREGVTAARLNHPGIVSTFDTCDDEVPVLVMELIPGRTVRELLRGGPVAPEIAVRIARSVADALAHAHGVGVIHRDVKPSNVILADDGRVLLTDLGVSRATDSSDLTAPDAQAVGTARYLSPELVAGQPADTRADLYALGVVLFEMVCGRPPFEGETELAAAAARMHRPPLRARQIRPDVHRPLDDLLARMLAPRPEDRPQNAADVQSELSEMAEGLPAPAAEGTDAWPDRVHSGPPRFAADPPDRPEPHTPRSSSQPLVRRSDRSLVMPAILLGLTLAALGMVGYLLAATGAGQDLVDATRDVLGGGEAISDFTLTAAAFDPQGDGSEHDSSAALAVDGAATTSWSTEGYSNRDIVVKQGVGLIVRLPTTTAIGEVTVATTSPGWRAELYVAGSPARELAGWGEPAAVLIGSSPVGTVDLAGRRGAAVLVWFTRLAADGPPFRVEVTELAVRSP